MVSRELFPGPCPVCGYDQFTFQKILWPELIHQWELNPDEAEYIDRQQGFRCARCKNNLRAMTLAAAVLRAFEFAGNFDELCRTNQQLRAQNVIEINQAGTLTPHLSLLPRHQLLCYPEVDLQELKLDGDSVDVLIHSDTLEHVPDSGAALKESYRVLKSGGQLFYTVPIVVGRMTRRRTGLARSYHGQSDTTRADYVVQTEYGADFWCEIFQAGFSQITLTSLVFPASIAIAVRKS